MSPIPNEHKTSAEFFESLYSATADPWNFSRSAYELGRYEQVVGSLRGKTFHNAFEPGCSVGVLTEKLAPFCEDLFAMDISATAISRAKERCSHMDHVHFRVGQLGRVIPEGVFDLIVFSEIGYYFTEAGLQTILRQLMEHLRQGGMLLGVHWLGYSPDHVLSGDHVHEIIEGQRGLTQSFAKRFTGYRMNHWIKR
jgi:predicted TPR repeat methyltransferase